MSCTMPGLCLDLDRRLRTGRAADHGGAEHEPVRFAIPPKMTMAKIVSENAKPNTLEWRAESQPEYIAPARPASPDVMPNTATL